jgi:thiamine biosynthesis lipoprotein
VGTHPHGSAWQIGVTNPFDPKQTLKVYALCDNSLSTSGNTSMHPQHIINPHSGIYTPERKIVSVVSENCVDAEALTTALMVADDVSAEKIKRLFPDAKSDQFDVKI